MMFSLTIVFGPSATAWRLLYKDAQKARDAFNSVLAAEDKTVTFQPQVRFTLEDDFGQVAGFVRAEIKGAMLENMDESKVGAVEFSLHNERTKASYQQRIENDPTLRAASASRGPGIISPVGNSRFS